MQDTLREELARETVTALLDQLRASAKIDKFNMDGSKVDPAAAKPAPAKPAATPAPPASSPPK
jgi:peptidyl-prolyl cis-trans isomerase C